MAVILFGVILALMSGYPIFGFLQGAAQNWLLVSNILLVLGLVSVPTIFVPRGKKFEPLLAAALAEGRMTPDLRANLDDKVVRLAHLYEEVALVIVIALMVFKPF
jgi:low temperature requirement protein LtrA